MLRSFHYWWPEAPEDHQKASEPHRRGAPGPVGPTSFKTDPLFVVFGARSWLLSQNAADSHKDFHIFPFASKTSPVECLTPEKKRCSIYYQSYPALKQVNGRKCTVLSEKLFVQHDLAWPRVADWISCSDMSNGVLLLCAGDPKSSHLFAAICIFQVSLLDRKRSHSLLKTAASFLVEAEKGQAASFISTTIPCSDIAWHMPNRERSRLWTCWEKSILS